MQETQQASLFLAQDDDCSNFARSQGLGSSGFYFFELLPGTVEDEQAASSEDCALSQDSLAADVDKEDGDDEVEEESCQLCETGGELLLCDSCNGGFHTSCVGLRDVPEGRLLFHSYEKPISFSFLLVSSHWIWTNLSLFIN